MSSPNLRLVAQAAGVAVATASMALRNRPEISVQTRVRVLEAATKLGYKVNPLVAEWMRNLRRRKRRQKVTMADIAARVGVSRATVSLRLRNTSAKTTDLSGQIADTVKALGYKRDPLHAALVEFRRTRATGNKHTTIAYLTSYSQGIREDYFVSHGQMHEGATKRAVDLGYRLAQFSLTAPGMTARRLREILLTRDIHAIIVAPTDDRTGRLNFDLERFSSVGLGLSVGWPRIERVSNDHFQSVLLAFSECLSLGYRRIGLVVSQAVSDRLGRRWLGGYLLAQQSLPPQAWLKPLMPDSVSDIPKRLHRWLDQERPDVIIYGDVEIGEALDREVDRRVGLVDLHVTEESGSIAGIFQASAEIGARAVESVVSQLHHNIKGQQVRANCHLLPGRWVPGRTASGCGKLRATSAKI